MAQPSVASLAISARPALLKRVAAFRPVAAVLVVAAGLLAIYVANSPHLDRFNDSGAYEAVANGMPGSFISAGRMPGYPALIALSSLLPGGREAGLMVTQALLILGAAVATFFIARMVLAHGWMAVVVALVVAADVLIVGYVRVVMTETLALFLASVVFLALLAYLREFRPRYLWVFAVALVALWLTRPEWAFLPVGLVPYMLVMAWRHGRLTRRVVVHVVEAGAGSLAGVLAYCTANLAVNGYFGLTSLTNVALLGKVMAYGIAGDAPGRYASLAPTVQASSSAWDLVTAPPFNDRNSALAGEYARSVIFHDPIRFVQDVMSTAITSLGTHDSQFLRIQDAGPFGHWLRLLLTVDQTRYRAFVILPALALAWTLAALIARKADYRLEALGVIGLIVLYDWLLTAAGTYGEFERLRMPTNPIATTIVLGTFLLLFRLALSDRKRLIPAVGLTCLEAAAIGLLPRVTTTGLSEAALLALAAVHTFVFVRWSGALTGAEPAPSPAVPARVA